MTAHRPGQKDAPAYRAEFDAGINRGLGLPDGVYHFAFETDSADELESTRQRLLDKGVKVRGIVDHDG